uniref:LY6/PLAUR domain containing 3 n=1 Tax=Pelusios castaneus TaxID=367368 RepID=A0A8C8SMS9_9SAUR
MTWTCLPVPWVSWEFPSPHVGAMALECHSCVERSDGGCSLGKMKMISCPANTSVCVETVAAVKWSHGQFLVGEKGCGMGIPGTNDKGVELHGIIAFSRLHQCNSSHCNSQLDIQAMALQPTGNGSGMVLNGLECYSCHGNETCSSGNTTVVKCYDGYRGCFHGNITIRVGETRGCAQDEHCTKEPRSNSAVSLVGSCCSGSLCNRDLANKTFFAHNIPRLDVLPSYGANATATNATATAKATGMATAATSATTTPLPDSDKKDLIGDGVHVTAESERRNNPGIKIPEGGKGGTAVLNASVWLVLLGAALLL